jgi:ribonuclease BN (tRNA processing enzyme)
MQLTILGNAAGAPGPDGACPGYLVRTETTTVLLDCGPGVVGKLVAQQPVHALTGVVLSHLHLDHIHDLPVLFLKRWMERAVASRRLGGPHALAEAPDLPVYLPPGGATYVESMLAAQGIRRGAEGVTTMLSGVELREYDPNGSLTIGELAFSFVGPTRHFPGECYAMRIADPQGALLAYSGDTAPDDLIVEMARNADCFLCEATLTGADGTSDQTGRHLTAREAGHYAATAGAHALVLTHVLVYDDAWYAEMEQAARESFAGPVSVAHLGQTFPVAATAVVGS